MTRAPLRRLLALCAAAFLAAAAPAARAVVLKGGGADAPVTLFGRVPAAWGTAISKVLTFGAASPGGLKGVLPDLQRIDVANPVARVSLSPVVQQLQIHGYSLLGEGDDFVLAKDGQALAPETVAEVLEKAAQNAASNVGFIAQELAAQARFGKQDSADFLDSAIKLRALGTDFSLYLSKDQLEQVALGYDAARARLDKAAADKLQAVLEAHAHALGQTGSDGLTLLEALAATTVVAPPSGEAKVLPKEWTLKPATKKEKVQEPKFKEVPAPRKKTPRAAPLVTAQARAAQEAAAGKIVAQVQADAYLKALFAGASDKTTRLSVETPLASMDAEDAANTKINEDLYEGLLMPQADAQGRSLRLGVGPGGRFLTLKMRSVYEGEATGKSPLTPQPDPKVYLKTEEQRAPYRPVISGGLLHDAKGRALHGVYNYVIGSDGSLYVDEPDQSDLSHASYVAGEPAAGAGVLVIYKGLLMGIGPQTGHFGVTGVFIAQALLHLRHSGVAIERARLIPLLPYDGPTVLFAEVGAGRKP